MPTPKTALTAIGAAKYANASIIGPALIITTMGLSPEEIDPIDGMPISALPGQVWVGPLTALDIDPESPENVMAEVLVPYEAGTWFVRSCALYDQAGDMIAVGSVSPFEKVANHVGLANTMIVHFGGGQVSELIVRPSQGMASQNWSNQKFIPKTLTTAAPPIQAADVLPFMRGDAPHGVSFTALTAAIAAQIPGGPSGAGLPIVEWDMTAQAFAAELSLFGTGPLIGQGYGIATTTSTKDYEISGVAGQLASGMAGIGNGFPMGTKKCIVWIPGVLEESPPDCVAYAANVVLATANAADPLAQFMQIMLTDTGGIAIVSGNVTTQIDVDYVIGRPVQIGIDAIESSVTVKTDNEQATFNFSAAVTSPALIGGALVYQAQAGSSSLSARMSTDVADLDDQSVISDFELLTDDLVSLPPDLVVPTLLKVIVSGNYHGVPYSIGDAAVFVGGDVVVPSGATGAQVAGLTARMVEAEKVTTKALEISVTDYTNLTGSNMTTDGTVPVSSNTKDITVNCGNAGNLLHLDIFPPPNTVPGLTSVGRSFRVTFTNVNPDGFVWVSTSSQGFGGSIQPFAVTSGDSIEFVYSEYSPNSFGYVIAEQVRNLNVGNKTWIKAYNLHEVAAALNGYKGRELTIATTGVYGFSCDWNEPEDFSKWGTVVITQDTEWSDLNQDFHVKGNIVLQEITGFVRSFKSYGTLTTRNVNITLYDTGTAYLENLKMKEYPASFTRQAGQTFDINGILRDETVGAIQQELQVNLAPTYGGDHCALVLSGPCEVNTIRIAAGHLKVTGDAKVDFIVNENTGALTELVRVNGTARLDSVECGTEGVTTAVVVDKGVVFANAAGIVGTFTNAFNQTPPDPTANGQIYA